MGLPLYSISFDAFSSSSFQKDINCDVVSYIAGRCGRFLTVISLRGCEEVSGEALVEFSEHCPNIEKVREPSSIGFPHGNSDHLQP